MSKACLILAEVSRWSYFVLALMCIMNALIHLHIRFEMSQCPDTLITMLIDAGYSTNNVNSGISCIGRNLAFRDNDHFNFDTNELFWRQTFSLQPDIFFDIWPPIIVSIIALLQHFDTFKWDIISGDWGRSLLFIIIWQLFTVIGYGSNFGVIIGFIGLCFVAVLYFIICILLLFGFVDVEIRDEPVLNLMQYVTICISVGDNIKKRRNSDIKSLNHDNDQDIMINEEQQALQQENISQQQSPKIGVMHHKQIGSVDYNARVPIDTHEFVNRLSVTQPGSQQSDLQELKHRPLPPVPSHDNNNNNNITPGGYAKIGQNDKSSSGDDDDDENEDSVIIHDDDLKDNQTFMNTKGGGNENENDDGIVYKDSDDDDMVKIPAPPPPPPIPPHSVALPTDIMQTGNDGVEIDIDSDSNEDSDSNGENDGLYRKPQQHYRTKTDEM